MDTPFSIIDYAIISFYFIFVIFLGLASSKRQSPEGFLIADRNLRTAANSTSMVATKTGAGAVITFVALVYLYGYSAMWFFVGASLGYIFFIFFASDLKKLSHSRSFYNLSDYYFFKFGNTVGFVSSIIILVYSLLIFLVQLIGGAKAVAHLSGFSYSISILLLIVTIFIYIVLGGFRAVVRTDAVQFISMVSILVLLGFVLTKAFDWQYISSALIVEKSLPLKVAVSFFVMGILVPFMSPDLWQRIYAARDLKTVQRSLIISSLMFFLVGVFLCIIGLAISAELHDIDPDLALLEGLITFPPAGLVGFGLVLFFAAIMSSADSYLFACISIVVHDLIVRVKPIEKDNLVKLFRYAVAVLLFLSFVASFWLKSVVNTTFIVLALGSVVAICAIISWGLQNMRSRTISSGMIIGIVGTVFFITAGQVNATLTLSSIALTIAGFTLEYLLALILRIKQNT